MSVVVKLLDELRVAHLAGVVQVEHVEDGPIYIYIYIYLYMCICTYVRVCVYIYIYI